MGRFRDKLVRIKKDYVEYFFLGLVVIIALLFITGTLNSLLGYSFVVIQNSDPNSMNPTYMQGDIFIIQHANWEEIKVGDVIVYNNPISNLLVIHRVILKTQSLGQNYLSVKGDNPVTNSIPDIYSGNSIQIPMKAVLGKIVLKAQYLGHLSLALQRNIGIQIILYLVAGGIGVSIWVFGKDDEESEDEFYDLNPRKFLSGITQHVSETKRDILIEKQVHKLFTYLILLLVLTLMISSQLNPGIYYPQQISNKPELVGATVDTSFRRSYQLTVNGTIKTYLFYQIQLQISDPGNLAEHISEINVKLSTITGTLLSNTDWNIMGRLVGKVVIGGTLIFDTSKVLNVDQNLPIDIKVVVSGILSSYTLNYTHDLQYKAI